MNSTQIIDHLIDEHPGAEREILSEEEIASQSPWGLRSYLHHRLHQEGKADHDHP